MLDVKVSYGCLVRKPGQAPQVFFCWSFKSSKIGPIAHNLGGGGVAAAVVEVLLSPPSAQLVEVPPEPLFVVTAISTFLSQDLAQGLSQLMPAVESSCF